MNLKEAPHEKKRVSRDLAGEYFSIGIRRQL